MVIGRTTGAAAVRKKPLYCAFIEFSKAYDRVDRALLWRVLQGMGCMVRHSAHCSRCTRGCN